MRQVAFLSRLRFVAGLAGLHEVLGEAVLAGRRLRRQWGKGRICLSRVFLPKRLLPVQSISGSGRLILHLGQG